MDWSQAQPQRAEGTIKHHNIVATQQSFMREMKILSRMDKSPSFLGPLGESKKALLGGVDSSRLRGFHIWSRSKRVPPILSSFFRPGSRVGAVRVSCARCACVANHIIA